MSTPAPTPEPPTPEPPTSQPSTSELPTVRFSVERTEAGGGDEPALGERRVDTFEVPYTDRTTVLDALEWVKEHADPTLTFRWSCKMAVCGSCGVMVNGRPVLGCETLVRGFRSTGITVGPLAHHEVLRDLVVDTDGLIERLTTARTWLIPPTPPTPTPTPPAPTPPAATPPADQAISGQISPERPQIAWSEGGDRLVGEVGAPAEGGDRLLGEDDVLAEAAASGMSVQTPGELAAFRGYAQCIDCMLCYAACPQPDADPLFLGPAAVATARRWDLDPRDAGAAERMAVMDTEHGMWPCIQVGACTQACPKGVDPARALREVQRIAMGG